MDILCSRFLKKSGIFPKICGINPTKSGIFPKFSGINHTKSGIFPKIFGINPRKSGIFPKIFGINPRKSGIWSYRKKCMGKYKKIYHKNRGKGKKTAPFKPSRGWQWVCRMLCLCGVVACACDDGKAVGCADAMSDVSTKQ